MTNVNIFFKEKDENKIIQLPIVPEEVQVTLDGNMQTLNVVNLGDVAIARTPNPATIKFESFFPLNSNLPLVQTRGKFWEPAKYIEYFNGVMERKNPVLLTITGFPKLTLEVFVSNFEYTWEGGSNDCNYSLTLVKYKEIRITTIPLISRYTKPKKLTSAPVAASATAKKVTPGCEVTLNGTVHRDSYGKGPGKTFSNYHGKVNFVKTDGRSHPYHVTTLSGGWLGWVVPSAVKVL